MVLSLCMVAYARQEHKYCVTRRELLAVVEFTHHFRPYLLGRQFTLQGRIQDFVLGGGGHIGMG